jgi:hypothetical protein
MSSKYSTTGWNGARRGHKAEHAAGGVRRHSGGTTTVLPDNAGFSWSSPGGQLFVPFASIGGGYSPDILDRLHRSLLAFEDVDQAHGTTAPFPPGVIRAAEMHTPPMGAAVSVLAVPESDVDDTEPGSALDGSVTDTDSIARADLPLLDQYRELDI